MRQVIISWVQIPTTSNSDVCYLNTSHTVKISNSVPLENAQRLQNGTAHNTQRFSPRCICRILDPALFEKKSSCSPKWCWHLGIALDISSVFKTLAQERVRLSDFKYNIVYHTVIKCLPANIPLRLPTGDVCEIGLHDKVAVLYVMLGTLKRQQKSKTKIEIITEYSRTCQQCLSFSYRKSSHQPAKTKSKRTIYRTYTRLSLAKRPTMNVSSRKQQSQNRSRCPRTTK